MGFNLTKGINVEHSKLRFKEAGYRIILSNPGQTQIYIQWVLIHGYF